MFCAIDINNVKKLLINSVIEDIEKFGKPALIYNYHHHKNNVLNTMDFAKQWHTEQKIMKGKGVNIRPVKKDVEINGDIWECIIWICQPLKDDNLVDEEKYLKLTNHVHDPLALAVGYMTSGFCYLAFINKK